MTHRIIFLGSQPQYVLRHIECAGSAAKAVGTNYRGPVAFVGLERVWVVGTMHDCKQGTPIPSTTVKVRDHAGRDTGERKIIPGSERYFWCFSELALIPAEFEIRCGVYDGKLWDSPRGPEPKALNCGAQAVLRDFLDGCEQLRQNGVEARETAPVAREQGTPIPEPIGADPQEFLAFAEMLARSGRDASNMADEVASKVCESGKRKGQLEMVW